MFGEQMVGERYRVVPYDEDTTFFGTCHSIKQVPIYDKFIKIKFVDITKFNELLPDKTILYHISDSLYINNCRFMKLMKPELTREIKGYNKIPTLANMCRSKIPYKTHIEIQGTYIIDVINNVVGLI
jgi:hypothetical protein